MLDAFNSIYMENESGNIPEVTGASRPAILGARYPAA